MKRALVFVAVAALTFSAGAFAADPQYRLDPADQAWTDTIVINAQDLGPGWQGQGSPGDITGGGTGASGACSLPDMSDLVLTGGTYSPDFFRQDGAYVAATAVSWQTPDEAAADWSRSFQPAVMGCLAGDLQAESTKQLKFVVTGRRQVAWPTFGERSVVYRISLVLRTRVKVHKKWKTSSAKARADFVAVGAGRARAMIWTFSLDAHPLSDVTEQKWAALMAQRMATPPVSG